MPLRMGRGFSVEEVLDKQIRKWNMQERQKATTRQLPPPVICVSRQTGSGGNELARGVAELLGFDLFDQALIQKVAASANTSAVVVASLDERWRSVMEDWIADWSDRHHLWLDDYLKHLAQVLVSIGKHGKAVVVGRGANFILNRPDCFVTLRVRVIAPLAQRVATIAKEKGVGEDEALKFVNRTDADRRAFVRKYYNESIDDHANYDLTLNMERLDIDQSVRIVQSALAGIIKT